MTVDEVILRLNELSITGYGTTEVLVHDSVYGCESLEPVFINVCDCLKSKTIKHIQI